ncbi:hypothetical protein TPHA_0D01290 [Tetrapisispora phaffii CBS 4417]|uniref:Uncharacterized protein n=1 Tax=Tetrapisispora phaffii (strain ATCC 24235 / CBS 4417 / NBRC 1672 / NRRL Y-8282 / UCD 70-5) TaxID=1071381 RepID=G8BSE9_TETPH|nr:hypothetical protein TPHA_0D01290 [Tetrapisispora phaffii CBS 4417]CCE62770.1 hypothetical protein TPHA_0D01290 [Tetrapisispora phaffii CBS 4417]
MFKVIGKGKVGQIGLSQVRFQSSITFLTNQNLLNKNTRNNNNNATNTNAGASGSSKTATGTGISKTGVATKGLQMSGGLSGKSLADKKVLDYSWLPKVPQTSSITHREITTNSLYSGYRPLFIDNKKGTLLGDVNSTAQDANSSIYEFAMKLNELSEPSPWMMSATGLESYSEWDYVPSKVIKKLKPYDLSIKENDTLNNIGAENQLARTQKNVNKKN